MYSSYFGIKISQWCYSYAIEALPFACDASDRDSFDYIVVATDQMNLYSSYTCGLYAM